MKPSLADIVHRNDLSAGRAFDIVILVLIGYSVATLSIETLPDLTDATRQWLNTSDVVISVLFSVEYLLRFFLKNSEEPEKSGFGYVFSFYGIIDFLAILPFYLAFAGIDAELLRAFRMVRVFRLLKILRYSQALQRFGRALAIAKREIAIFLLTAGILLYLSAVGIYFFEHEAQPEHFPSILHSLWWAVVTLTTVGYGDVYPVTAGGKVFTGVVVMVGIGIISVPSGIVAAALTEARKKEGEKKQKKQE